MICLAFSGIAAAKSDMLPSAGSVLPLEKRGEAVLLTHDVLLGNAGVLAAGTRLRTVFGRPKDSINPRDLRRPLEERVRESVARPNPQLQKETPEQRKMRQYFERMAGVVWSDPVQFRGAVEFFWRRAPRLIFEAPPGAAPEVMDLAPVVGLWLIRKEDQVEVLSVQTDSTLQRQGVAAGMKLISVMGQSLGGRLERFVELLNESGQKHSSVGRVMMVFENASGQRLEVTVPTVRRFEGGDVRSLMFGSEAGAADAEGASTAQQATSQTEAPSPSKSASPLPPLLP